jgi:hypothetical protein
VPPRLRAYVGVRMKEEHRRDTLRAPQSLCLGCLFNLVAKEKTRIKYYEGVVRGLFEKCTECGASEKEL